MLLATTAAAAADQEEDDGKDDDTSDDDDEPDPSKAERVGREKNVLSGSGGIRSVSRGTS